MERDLESALLSGLVSVFRVKSVVGNQRREISIPRVAFDSAPAPQLHEAMDSLLSLFSDW